MSTLMLMAVMLALGGGDQPLINWHGLFKSVKVSGVEYSDQLRALEGKRVVLRGCAVALPRLDGGIFVTRFPHNNPQDVEESDLPFDAIAVVWRHDVIVPPVPQKPTVSGVLRLGNRRFGTETVAITLEDAEPVLAPPRQ